MKTCLICGDRTKRPIAAVLEHFRPLDWKQRSYAPGTFRIFGIRAAVTLMSPMLNTILNWRYRRHRLEAPFCALDELPNSQTP
jgi:hypothetical protein